MIDSLVRCRSSCSLRSLFSQASPVGGRRCVSRARAAAAAAAVCAQNPADTSSEAQHTPAAQLIRHPDQLQQQQQLQQLQVFQTELQEELAQHADDSLEQQHLPHTQLLEEQLILQMQANPLNDRQKWHQKDDVQAPASLQHNRAAAHLSACMKKASSWHELAELVQTYAPTGAIWNHRQQTQQQPLALDQAMAQLNPQHLACLLSTLAKVQPRAPQQAAAASRRALANHQQRKEQQQLQKFTQLAYEQVLLQLSVLQGREVSTILWAASKLQHPPAAIHIKQLLTHVTKPAVLKHANAQDISMCLYAAASLGLQVPEHQIEALLSAAAAKHFAAAPQAVANTLWAVAALQYRPHEQWLQVMEQRSCSMLQHQQQQRCQQQQGETAAGFAGKGLHQLLWAMAKLQWVPEQQFLDLFWAASAHQLPYMSPHGTAGLVWAAASFGVQPPEQWMQSWLATTQHQLTQHRLNDQDVSNALWGLVRLGVQPSKSWLALALEASMSTLASAGSQELAVTLWGWAKLGVKPPQQWMQLWMTAMAKRMGSYCAPALASSAYALALLRYKPPQPWCEVLVAETQRQMAAFGAQELSNLIWAFAVLGLRPNTAWLRDFERQVLDESGSFNAQELSLVCWSLAKMGHRPPVGLVASLLSDGLELQGGLAGQSVVLLMVALVMWDYPELKEGGKFRMLLPRYWAASQQLLPSCTLYQLSVLWWARARLGCMPNTSWSNSFWAAVTPTLAAALQATTASASSDAAGHAAAVRPGSTGGQAGNTVVPSGAEVVHSTVSPAVVARLIWATGKMSNRAPPVTARLLLQAAKLVLPSCSFHGLTTLGTGLMHVNKAAARPAVQSRAAAVSLASVVTTAGQQRLSPSMRVGRAQLMASEQQAFWQSWFTHSTQVILQDAKVTAWLRMQQQLELLPARQGSSALHLLQRPQRQYGVSCVDVVMQLSIAAHLQLKPPSSWSEAMLSACIAYLPAMTLKQVTWLVWAVVQLGMGHHLPPGWLHGVLGRVLTEIGLADGAPVANTASIGTCMLRLRKGMKELHAAGVVQGCDWLLWCRTDKQWQGNAGR